ncbi:DAK2 domain-containing protein, partial [Mesorhizobium sp. M7A.F.Ca.MR.362.00.0.0]
AGANSTRSMVAARGRAARLGERSLGHMDPGAASAVIILRAMKDTFGEPQG